MAARKLSLISSTASGIGASASAAGTQSPISPVQVYVDKLFRTEAAATPTTSPATGTAAPAPGAGNEAARAEVTRLWTLSLRDNNELAPADRTYIARLVAAQTGMSQQDAERRVNDIINEAKTAADKARRGAAKLAFWMTAALIFGAFAASLAAVEGGQLRDGTWTERGLVKRAWA